MQFLRLIRPLNLAIIAFTMYGVRYYLYHFSEKLGDNGIDFALWDIPSIHDTMKIRSW